MTKKDLAKDLIRVAVIVIFCAYILLIVAGYVGSLGVSPREWTEVKDARCHARGDVPVINHNTEVTRCSADIFF